MSGDSISQGYNASGFTQAPPLQPPYPRLVADELDPLYGTQVTLRNCAVAGWSVAEGLADLYNLLAEKPDLVFLAYGMNDVGGHNPEAYKKSIEAILKRILDVNPDAEVVLVASMLGNPEWTATPPDMFPKYRDALASLTRPGVVLADMTSLWQELLKRKKLCRLDRQRHESPQRLRPPPLCSSHFGPVGRPRAEQDVGPFAGRQRVTRRGVKTVRTSTYSIPARRPLDAGSVSS